MRPSGPVIALIFTLGIILVNPGRAAGTAERSLMPGHLLGIENLATFELAAKEAPREPEKIQSPVQSPSRRFFPADLVRQIQKFLARQGFYLGPVNGIYEARTAAAIRAYQISAEFPVVDGLPSPQLALDLKTDGQISRLLFSLEKSRTAAIKNARAALRSHPQTRALLDAPATPSVLSKTPMDAATCVAAPTARCLLNEAVLSARDIEKPQMRDWALGEILVSQARAGLAADAMVTTRRIHDPRLIMVALRYIAKAQANAGNTRDALAAVDIIPDADQQGEAYIAIAAIYAQRGRIKDTALVAERLENELKKIKAPLTKIAYRTRIAVILYRAKITALVRDNLRKAKALVVKIPRRQERDKALRYIATAYGETGNPAQALKTLKEVNSGADDAPTLIATALGLVQSGDEDQALITAESIEAVRYRALVLTRIASYQAGTNNVKKAHNTLDKALKAAQAIRFPYARAFALSRIALAFNKLGVDSKKALATAQRIKDGRLKAQTLWSIADARLRAGDPQGAKRTATAAQNATDDIKSPFARVWMLSNIAENRARHREPKKAWILFRKALNEAATITHPWSRARAFSKVASTMNALNSAAP